MKRLIFSLMALSMGLAAPIFAERMLSEDGYITGGCEKNKKCEKVKCAVCPTGPTGLAGATGSTGVTGPTGFLTANFGSFFNDSVQDIPTLPEMDNVLFPNTMPGVTPVGVTGSTTIGTTGSIFTVDTSGIYTVGWIVVVINDTGVQDTAQFFFAENGVAFPPRQAATFFPDQIEVLSGSETLDLVAGNQYSFQIGSSLGLLFIDGASLSITQVAP